METERANFAQCTRGEDHGGEVFLRTSRSGLTTSWICEKHAQELEEALDGVAQRYPEVNHPDGCTCWGCSEGSY